MSTNGQIVWLRHENIMNLGTYGLPVAVGQMTLIQGSNDNLDHIEN